MNAYRDPTNSMAARKKETYDDILGKALSLNNKLYNNFVALTNEAYFDGVEMYYKYMRR